MVVFCEDDQKHTIPPGDSFTLVSANMDPLAPLGRAAFRALINAAEVDLLHVPSPWAPTPLAVPFVSTMHDVTPFLYPRSVPPRLRLRYRRQLAETLEESRQVIAVSQILYSASASMRGSIPPRSELFTTG
jgi:hypothetical protein